MLKLYGEQRDTGQLGALDVDPVMCMPSGLFESQVSEEFL